jgi:hypothetical protein
MNSFLLIVQTGLLLYTGATGRDYISTFNGDNYRNTLLNAMEDGIVLQAAKEEGLIKEDRVKLGTKDAKEFVKYVLYGTSFAWIEDVLGDRTKRPY